MRRTLIALLLCGVIFTGTYGFAASLGLTSDTLGAGNSTVAACQGTSLTVSYTPSYSAVATAGYRATTVTVGAIAAGCYSKAIRVTLSDAADASLGEQTGTTPSSGSTQAFTFTGVAATAVTGVHVVISG